MVYVISAIIVIFSIIYVLKRFQKNSQRIFFLLSIVVIFLVLTGRAHWLSAIVVALIPLVKKLFLILRYLPILQRFSSYYSQKKQGGPKQSMSIKEAADILNVSENASEDEIILAHKKAMQKNHPDKGGSKEIASKINTAKKRLLDK
tara:strand:+ start:176 stop:616 length:441 start_codon:yes stop_codon:yes gene_type:complete